VNSVQPTLAFAPGRPLDGTGAPYKYDHDGDPGTPTVEVPYVQKAAITVDGLQFRDLNGSGALEKYEDWRYSGYCRAVDLVERMTVKQKVGLMAESSTITGFGGLPADGVIIPGGVASIAYDHRRQALIRLAGTGQAHAEYLNDVQAMCEGLPLGIPFVITTDPSHGTGMSTAAATGAQTLSAPATVSPWPYPLGLGAINDKAVTRAYGDAVRHEFMAMGFRWQLGPMADLGTEPRWARVQNVFGENAFHVAKHVQACVEGFQGVGDGGLANGIASTMKHFPGAGANEDGMDSHSRPGKFNVYPGAAFEYHSIPFQAAVDAGVAAVMPCYSIFKGQTGYDPEQVGAAFSEGLITNYLKYTLGFTGMVTSDWGTMSGTPWGVEALTQPERAAKFVKAGSNQLGLDSHLFVQQAYDQGLLTDDDIDGAAVKILEMSLKLGIFENPYVDAAAAPTIVRSEQNLRDGFEAQKKAIVLLRSATLAGARYLPVSGTRYSDANANGAPDVGEYHCDTDGDGVVEVYYDGVVDDLVGTDIYSPFLGDYDYTSAAAAPAIAVTRVVTAAEADIAILRITARKGTYFGLDAGVPLSFDAPFPGAQTDNGLGAAVKDAHKVIDLFRVRDGYTDSTGAAVAATKPTLKIVLVMHMDRPGIVKPFVNGLRTLDETPEVPGSYPLVSDEANINPGIVTTSTPTAKAGVEAFLVEFGAFDRALLDFLFAKNPIAGWTYGAARLPMEIPSSDAQVDAQYEDLPADSASPTFGLGAGSNLPAN
jgi:beta-glucosidase